MVVMMYTPMCGIDDTERNRFYLWLSLGVVLLSPMYRSPYYQWLRSELRVVHIMYTSTSSSREEESN